MDISDKDEYIYVNFLALPFFETFAFTSVHDPKK